MKILVDAILSRRWVFENKWGNMTWGHATLKTLEVCKLKSIWV
ncbi:MAG: hypothetical protein ACYSU6_07445 [Planctomycetota bacterium]|jgi:hypothetical protein